MLIVLYVGTQLASTHACSTMTADPNQRRLMLALPFVFVIFVFRFPAGLLVYWVATNIWTIGQQLCVKRFLPPPEPIASGQPPRRAGGARGRMEPRAKPLRRARPPRRDGEGRDGGSRRAGARQKPARPPSGAADGGNGAARKAPPPSPRKRKKRSGRRR